MINESESAKMSFNVIDVHPFVSTFVSMGVPSHTFCGFFG